MEFDFSFLPNELQYSEFPISKPPFVKINGNYLPLPCNEQIIQSFLPFCTKSAFGKAQDTLYDDNVRKTLEITCDQIQLPQDFVDEINAKVNNSCLPFFYDENMEKQLGEMKKQLEEKNKQWEDYRESNDIDWAYENVLRNAQHKVAEEFGIMETFYKNMKNATQVSVELYKLLIYQQDGFFEKHLDTVRSPRHFGTLVVLLPCVCDGGELVLHGKEELVFQCSATETKAILFPTQMSHEVLPVKSGVKICLTFNLYCDMAIGFSQSLDGKELSEKVESLILKHDFSKPLVTQLHSKYSVKTKDQLIGRDFLLRRALHLLGFETEIYCLKIQDIEFNGDSFDFVVREGDCNFTFENLETSQVFDTISVEKMRKKRKIIANKHVQTRNLESDEEEECDNDEDNEEDEEDDDEKSYNERFRIYSGNYQYNNLILKNMDKWVKFDCENTGNEGAAMFCVYSDCFMVIKKKTQ